MSGTQDAGACATLTLTHAGSGSSLELVPDAGMVALSWTVAGREALALPCARAEFLSSARTGGLPLLYPYANRLGADRLEACGRSIDLARVPTLKRDDKGHPIHGLLLRRGGWSLAVLGPGAIEAELDWRSQSELMAAYPFPHALRIAWSMRAGATPGSAALAVTTTIDARFGADVPAAFGWHPYFAVERPEVARIMLAPVTPVELGEQGLPAPGAVARSASGAAGVSAPQESSVGQGQDALFRRDIGSAPGVAAGASASAPGGVPGLAHAASIVDAHRRIDIRMDRSYPFMQLFSPKGASFVCIEPMSAPTDALRSGDASVVRAGSTLAATFEVEITPCPPASAQG